MKGILPIIPVLSWHLKRRYNTEKINPNHHMSSMDANKQNLYRSHVEIVYQIKTKCNENLD